VQSTLTMLGIDTRDPIMAQSTFQSLRGLVKTFADEDFQKDLQHIRYAREGMDKAKSKGWEALGGAIVSGILIFIVLGFKDWIK
jgi:hypothetical protein